MPFLPLHISSTNTYGVPLDATSYGKWLGNNSELNIVSVPGVLTDSVEDRLTVYHVAGAIWGAQLL